MPAATAAAITTTLISSACSECGIIKKSGKVSCCASGGSWVEDCGGAGDPNFNHTWLEGVQACQGRQSQVVAGQQVHASQPNNVSSNDADIGMGAKTVVAANRKFASASVSTSAVASATKSSSLSVNMSINAPIIASTQIPSDTPGPNSDKYQPSEGVSIDSKERKTIPYDAICISMILVVVQ